MVESRPAIWGGSRVVDTDPLAGTTVALIKANGFPFCTGSYMGANMVLTAAHCVTRLESPALFVSFDLETPTEFDPIYGNRGALSPKARRVVRTIAHSAFDASRFSKSNIKNEPNAPLNDIALVFFEGTTPDGATPVELVGPTLELTLNSDIVLAGFGRSDAQGGDYGRLYKVNTHVGDIRNRSREIVDGPNSAKGSCVGDSGGPVIVANPQPFSNRTKFTVAGVVSYGPDHCESGTGFNTDLRFYREWVENNHRWKLGDPHNDAFVNELRDFVPTAQGSFFQICRDRLQLPQDYKTVSIILERLKTTDCSVAARAALTLKELDLSHSDITSIDALRHFVALEKLNLSFNQISELSPISYLSNLRDLNLVEAGVRWKDYKHPYKVNPLSDSLPSSFRMFVRSAFPQGTDLQALPQGPYSPGIWLTALKNLKNIEVEEPKSLDLTPRYAF